MATEKMIKQISVVQMNELINGGGAYQIIDVREYGEFDAEKIHQAKLAPLSNFETHAGEIDRSQPVYLMCRSGNRARQAAEKLVEKGFGEIYVIEGGMTAWKDANLPVIKGESKVWSLERQVRFAAGSLVVLGVLLSIFVHPYLIGLSALVGAGLVFAAATDTCAMAMLLARMPWNKAKAAACETTAQKI